MLDVFDRYPDSEDSQDSEGVIEEFDEVTAPVEKSEDIPHEGERMSAREENRMTVDLTKRMPKSFENWHKKLLEDMKLKQHKNLKGSSNSMVSVYRDAVYKYLISTNYDRCVTNIVIDLLDNWQLKYFKPDAESRVGPENVIDYQKTLVMNKTNRESRIDAVIMGLNQMGDTLGLDIVAMKVFDKVRHLESTDELIEYTAAAAKRGDPFSRFFFLEKWYLISSYVGDEYHQNIDREVLDRAEVLGGESFAKKFYSKQGERTADEIRGHMRQDYLRLKETQKDLARAAILDFMKVIEIHCEGLHEVAAAAVKRKASKYVMKCLHDEVELDMGAFLADIDLERHGELGELNKPVAAILSGTVFKKFTPFQVLLAGAKRSAEPEAHSLNTHKRSKGFSQGKTQNIGSAPRESTHEKKDHDKSNDHVLAQLRAQFKPRGNGIKYPKPEAYREKEGFHYCDQCGGPVKGQAHCFDHATGKALRPLKYARKLYAYLDKKHT